MALPRVLQGSYVAEDGRREVEYETYCEHCLDLKECKKRRAPVEGCEIVGVVRFLVDGQNKAYETGVITLRKINAWVKKHLECDWDDVPADIAMPGRQMTFEELI